MSDIMSKEKRSALMSRIRGRDTGIEKTILAELKKRKLGRFKYQPKIFGRPDLVFPDQKVAVFCDGDFWHGYRFESWKSKLDQFWLDKISKNMQRDKKVRNRLKREGWKVIRLWGHNIQKNPLACAKKIQKILDGGIV